MIFVILKNYVFQRTKTFVWLSIARCPAISSLQYCAAFSCLAFSVASFSRQRKIKFGVQANVVDCVPF